MKLSRFGFAQLTSDVASKRFHGIKVLFKNIPAVLPTFVAGKQRGSNGSSVVTELTAVKG